MTDQNPLREAQQYQRAVERVRNKARKRLAALDVRAEEIRTEATLACDCLRDALSPAATAVVEALESESAREGES